MNTFEKVQGIIADTLSCNADEILETTNITDDLGADSLDAVELSMALEEAFDITINDEDMQLFKTPSDIVKYIESHQ